MYSFINFMVVSAIIVSLAALPIMALQTMVMPQIESLQYTYAHAGETTEALFAQQ